MEPRRLVVGLLDGIPVRIVARTPTLAHVELLEPLLGRVEDQHVARLDPPLAVWDADVLAVRLLDPQDVDVLVAQLQLGEGAACNPVVVLDGQLADRPVRLQRAPPNDRISDDTAVTRPALPSSIRPPTIRRRTGWVTTSSASDVVNPTPVSAERAWKRADSRDIPVSDSATVATRTTSSDSSTITSTEMRATIALLVPGARINRTATKTEYAHELGDGTVLCTARRRGRTQTQVCRRRAGGDS
jgi:hypothetical protein